jgi:hypothetical protein
MCENPGLGSRLPAMQRYFITRDDHRHRPFGVSQRHAGTRHHCEQRVEIVSKLVLPGAKCVPLPTFAP